MPSGFLVGLANEEPQQEKGGIEESEIHHSIYTPASLSRNLSWADYWLDWLSLFVSSSHAFLFF